MQLQPDRPEPSLPEAQMGRILHSARQAIGELACKVDELDRRLAEVRTGALPAHLDRLSGHGVEVFRGESEVRQLLEDTVATATGRILSMHPGTPLPASLLLAARRRDEEVLGRGVAVRTIHSESMLRVPRGRAHLKALRRAGAQIRTSATLPYRLTVLDTGLALVPAPTCGNGGDGGDCAEPAVAVVRNPGLVSLFAQTFEFCWQDARPAELAPPSRTGPTARQYQVLRLMQLGYKDEAIAREIGVSSRTMRRIVRELLEQLDATSRFSAGTAAQARGWLVPPPPHDGRR
ncbi:LuxR C-terminal-related transcriptional regulator [Kitasatospora sp. SolWspMP-SS2h]|uniref:helix-turn-helix transcriptional regulator n=1 Tax=Kitasatospora sp. SolWspMP-SS2h TaxID=1305729 RepID=UPI0011B94572|nr:LuxR C-terminal-related transcriptional regulator [Kitasatospora sp. SolWspMP-SS2h]